MFKLNFKIALRNLWKNKAYTFINAGGLAIGLASCMLLLLYVTYELGYDKQFTHYENTYIVYSNQKNAGELTTNAYTPAVMASELKAKIPGAIAVSHSTYPENHLISYKEGSFNKLGLFGDPDFLKILDYKFLKGNPASVLREVNSVILTATMARNLFGSEDPINKTIKIDNKEWLKVEAVIEDVPKNSSIQFSYLMPWRLLAQENPAVEYGGWGNFSYLTLVQLQGEQFFSQANDLIRTVYKQHDSYSTMEAFLHPLSKWHLYAQFENGKSVGGKIGQVRIFLLLAVCILLIACVNFMNLSTARSEKRAKEVGVRKAIGSSRKSLIGQFMLESLLLSFLGMLAAFILLEVALPYFNNLLNIQLAIYYTDWKFWSALIGLTLLTGVVAGSYPAFYLSSFEPVKVLKGFKTGGGSSLSIRQVLVVFQFSFAACLIVCTAVIYQQLNYIRNKPIGYSKNNLLEIRIDGNLKSKEKLQLLEDQLLTSGAVTHVAHFNQSISEGGMLTWGVDWPGKNKNDEVIFAYRSTGYGFAKTMGTPMVLGREFSPRFADSASVIVNETAIKIMGLKNPIGSYFKADDKRVKIIGVMKDFVMESPYERAKPMIIDNQMNFSDGQMTQVRVIVARLNTSENISSSIDKIDGIFKAINPGFPVQRKFVDDNFEAKFQNEKLLGTMANWFGGFAVFISCLGLLGLALFMAEQRKKEISIRKVLGASNLNIVTLLNKEFIRLVALANLMAFPLGYIVMNHWLSSYSFRVAISFLPFAIALCLSLLIAILTVSVQSVKVANANPIDALKYE
ncbi:ABC transporter permease [Pedobacter sp. L105]|uniref:ABC transporter permease n=1 Tax=Pedobacter sp. L105 TaxID=1641871 RepID=UPI00131B6710|nr:ABC transporter permease [Pedobacter sp. L105]